MLCTYTVRIVSEHCTKCVHTLYVQNMVEVHTFKLLHCTSQYRIMNFVHTAYVLLIFDIGQYELVCTDLYLHLQVWPSMYNVHRRAWSYSVWTLYVRVWASTSRVSGFQMGRQPGAASAAQRPGGRPPGRAPTRSGSGWPRPRRLRVAALITARGPTSANWGVLRMAILSTISVIITVT